MRLHFAVTLCLILLEASKGSSFADEKCDNSREMNKLCGEYANNIVKPMMAYFKQVNQQIEKHNEEIESKNNQIRQLQLEMAGKNDKIHKFEIEVASYQSKDQLHKEKDESNAELVKSLKEHIQTLTKSIETQEKQNIEILQLIEKTKLDIDIAKKCEIDLNSNQKIAKGCIAHNSTGVYNKTIGNNFTFEVLCNSDIAGPGWTIIQQRIRGGVDFYRNWETYRNGFGDFWDGDFFLGLEKIHRLTTEQPHELYIHMEKFDGSTFYARYNEFAIEGESDQYRVTKLSGFSGSKGVTDKLCIILNMKFSTYDRDNDTADNMNCAEYFHNGWWNKACYNSNLNGKYHGSELKNKDESVHWILFASLKQVKMMIRPKTVTK